MVTNNRSRKNPPQLLFVYSGALSHFTDKIVFDPTGARVFPELPSWLYAVKGMNRLEISKFQIDSYWDLDEIVDAGIVIVR